MKSVRFSIEKGQFSPFFVKNEFSPEEGHPKKQVMDISMKEIWSKTKDQEIQNNENLTLNIRPVSGKWNAKKITVPVKTDIMWLIFRFCDENEILKKRAGMHHYMLVQDGTEEKTIRFHHTGFNWVYMDVTKKKGYENLKNKFGTIFCFLS